MDSSISWTTLVSLVILFVDKCSWKLFVCAYYMPLCLVIFVGDISSCLLLRDITSEAGRAGNQPAMHPHSQVDTL